MSEGSRKLIATDKPAVVSEPFLDTIVVYDSQSDGRLPDPPRTDEGDWSEVPSEVNDLLDEFVTSETGPRWRGWGFTRYPRCEYKIPDPSTVETTDLF